MISIKHMTNEVLKFYADNIDKHYRIAVIIVGAPGSGKSTIAIKLRDELNQRYQKYMREESIIQRINKSGENDKLDICNSINEITDEQLNELEKNKGTLVNSVEDTDLQPVKITSVNDEGRKIVQIIGRGGIANAIKVDYNPNISSNSDLNIAQILPMDGFHLSRKCLDNFKDAKHAHKRRGSPPTFDSNNFLELTRILSKTMTIAPLIEDTLKGEELFSKTALSFDGNVPDISVPGFDHSLKDPTPDMHHITMFTRILIFEGLYLLYDQENWKNVSDILLETGAVLLYKINVDNQEIEKRVAKRHVESGLVSSLAEGRKKYQENDLLNARLIEENMVSTRNIKQLSND